MKLAQDCTQRPALILTCIASQSETQEKKMLDNHWKCSFTKEI